MKKTLHETLLIQIRDYCGSDYSKEFDVLEQLNLQKLDSATGEALAYLEEQKFIEHNYDDNRRLVVNITYAGCMYVKNELKNRPLHWIKKNLLELIAIAIAVTALIAQLWK